MSDQTPAPDSQTEDVREAHAAAAARRERMASLSMGERLERLHRLCQQLAALGTRSAPRP